MGGGGQKPRGGMQGHQYEIGIYVAWTATASGSTACLREVGSWSKTNSMSGLAATSSLHIPSLHIKVHYVIPYSSLGVTGAAQNCLTSHSSPHPRLCKQEVPKAGVMVCDLGNTNSRAKQTISTNNGRGCFLTFSLAPHYKTPWDIAVSWLITDTNRFLPRVL
jgi:hypothetical protein